MHIDLAVNYSQGKIPSAPLSANPEIAPFLALYASPEFLSTNNSPPPWKQSVESVSQKVIAKEHFYQDVFRNDEAAQPPLYYAIAGAWWRLGKVFGLDGLSLLYWLRFLNALLVAAVVCLGWFAARALFPENKFIQIAVPSLVAFLPQTIFYAVNNDNLSALTFGLAFLFLLKFWQAKIPAPQLGAILGLALAATYLTKISNLPLLGVSAIFIAIKMWQLAKQNHLRATIPAIIALGICAGAPLAAWMTWCKIHFGDFTGSEEKIKFLGWTHKPFAEWFQHPIFTLHGFWIFLSGNLQTFWQGEMLWQRKALALPMANWFYSLVSIVFIAFALCGLKRANTNQKMALRFAFAGLIAMLAFFGFLSVIYDFQNCFYPSREHPYFTSGRLLLGTLIPFFLLFSFGLDRLLEKFSMSIKFIVLVTMLLSMLAMETIADWPVFPSKYNWFHI